MNIPNFIQFLNDYLSNGCKFISFTYKSKETGEVSKIVVNLGVSYENAKKNDFDTLNEIGVQENEISEIARQELIKSMVDADKTRSEGQTNAYINLIKGGAMKFNIETQKLYLFGVIHSKTILVEGVHKVINSSAKTIAKNKLKKDLRTSKFRAYVLDMVEEREVKAKGEVIEIE